MTETEANKAVAMAPDQEDIALPPGLEELLPGYLGRQRWYAGGASPVPDRIRVVKGRRVPLPAAARAASSESTTGVTLHQLLVESEGSTYQLLIGQRPWGIPAEFLHGQDDAVLGTVDGQAYYDAVVHPELIRGLLEVVSDGAERAERVRRITAEQSNTSMVYDDRVILKVFRRLLPGGNPDVDVTTALAGAGFAHVAAPVATWRWDGWDMAFAQQYLAGGSEGWALALTSLRDLNNSTVDDPASAGGDFAGEAARLGQMTAEMHLALAEAFGLEPDGMAGARWAALLESVDVRLRGAREVVEADGALGEGAFEACARSVLGRLEAVQHPGPAIRVHGDYHLGQVMQTDTGWYVLDFEGEPARALDERVAPSSPLKDTAGMIRSFGYAARFALGEREVFEMERLGRLAEAWEARNRAAFVDGYRRCAGIADLLPHAGDVDSVLEAFELDKALYELDYEQAYRPEWVPIPLSVIRGLLMRPNG